MLFMVNWPDMRQYVPFPDGPVFSFISEKAFYIHVVLLFPTVHRLFVVSC